MEELRGVLCPVLLLEVMGRRKRRKRKRLEVDLEPQTLHGIFAVILISASIFFVLSAFELAGVAGNTVYETLFHIFGIGYYLLPILGVIFAVSILRSLERSIGYLRSAAAVLFFIAGLALVDFFAPAKSGVLGSIIANPLVSLFDVYASMVILVAVFVISILVIFNVGLSIPTTAILGRFSKKDEDSDLVITGNEDIEDEPEDEECDEEEYETEESDEESPETDEDDFEDVAIPIHTYIPYKPPPLSILEKDRGKASVGDVRANANIIKRTLSNFGIDVVMDEVTVGPTVTRYTLKPAEGVRLSKILSLQNNLELALAAHPVRIEAPIPGKSLVGIEMPNTDKSTVGLGSLFSKREFKDAPYALALVLGKNLQGDVSVSNLSKMPHLLIAGATGAGKSVTIHSLIMSLIYRNGPQAVKFLLVDPKRVELTLYKGIPHLLTSVITDAKKTIQAMKWLAKEMERRYNILEEHQVRDISSYHSEVLQKALNKAKKGEEMPDPLPHIVCIVDELADIMSAYPRELEAAIVRLAQMSRAVGIHLILSTQRPSVNVITGLIKANIPARIALQVSSQIDSRTILDMAGAEKLLGAGDMLYLSADMSKPVRIQGGFISDREVKEVAQYLRKAYKDELPDEIDLPDGSGSAGMDTADMFEDEEEEDELYDDARTIVIESGKGSVSYLQRRLGLGYSRAARIMDMLEERKVVGPQNGSKPREVLIEHSEEGDNSEEDEDYEG